MFLQITPEGPDLSAAQARQLDDEFFQANPRGYFSARIGSLMELLERDGDVNLENPWPGLRMSPEASIAYTKSDQSLQLAADAFAVRHHAAEALVRLLHALIVPSSRSDAPSTWALITDGPTTLHVACAELMDVLNAKGNESLLASRLFPNGTKVTDEVQRAFGTAVAWLNHATHLLTSDGLEVNAANNKMKHGLAVRMRNDVRIELMVGLQPRGDGTVPLSAFGVGKSIPIFDRPMLTYLSRPHPAKKNGLETSSLRVDVPLVLAEAWMISLYYGAFFHVAAAAHFTAGEERPTIAPYPTMPLSPTPDELLGNVPLGYRGVVTTPPGGGVPRESGLFFHGMFQQMTIDIEGKTSAVIVDDDAPNPTE